MTVVVYAVYRQVIRVAVRRRPFSEGLELPPLLANHDSASRIFLARLADPGIDSLENATPNIVKPSDLSGSSLPVARPV